MSLMTGAVLPSLRQERTMASKTTRIITKTPISNTSVRESLPTFPLRRRYPPTSDSREAVYESLKAKMRYPLMRLTSPMRFAQGGRRSRSPSKNRAHSSRNSSRPTKGMSANFDDRKMSTYDPARKSMAPDSTEEIVPVKRNLKPRKETTVRDWTGEEEIDVVKGKADIKRRYWNAVKGLGEKEVQNSGLHVRKLRYEIKKKREDYLEVEEEVHLKDIVFPPWKRSSQHFRNHSAKWSTPVLDNDVLGLKKRLDNIKSQTAKKKKKVDEQEKELEHMIEVYTAFTTAINKDPIWREIKRKTYQNELLSMQLEHSENIRNHYKRCQYIVRKGNVLLLRKIDRLEEAANRLMRERWELYTIKVQATNLRDESFKASEEMMSETLSNRREFEKQKLNIQGKIHKEKMPQDLLDRIEGLDREEQERARKALTTMMGKGKKTIKDKAHGPEAISGPKLRKLAYKIIRMKYEDKKDELEKSMHQALKTLQSMTGALSVEEIIYGLKEQKDITLFLQSTKGKLQNKHMLLVRKRDQLREMRDALVSGYSNDIIAYDDEGQEKHREIEKWRLTETDQEHDKYNAANLINDVHITLRSISWDLQTKDVKPIQGKKRNKAEMDSRGPPKVATSGSLEQMRKSIKDLIKVDTSSPQDSTGEIHPTILLMQKVDSQLDDLLALKSQEPELKWKLASERLGSEEGVQHTINHSFQEYSENAIYPNPRITWQNAAARAREEADANLTEDQFVVTEAHEDKQDEKVMNRDQRKDYSVAVIEECKARRFRVEEEVKPRGNYHKYC